MKIFLDTAHLPSIEKALKTGLIDGITTNPTHLSKESAHADSMTDFLKKICALVEPGDVSIEVTDKEPEEVYTQARRIASIASNVVVKIPCHSDYVPIIKKLVAEGIALNITLLFSLEQGLLMAKLGVKYISPFIGRLEDVGADGISLIDDLREMIDNYEFSTKILAASIRSKEHVGQSALAGADLITIPVPLFESLMHHPLTDKGMKLFDADWQSLGIKKFP